MRKMFRFGYSIVFLLLCCVLSVYGVAAMTDETTLPTVTDSKDGLTAVLTVKEDTETVGKGEVHVALTNESGGCISDITVELVFPDSLVSEPAEPFRTITVAESETAEITVQFCHIDTISSPMTKNLLAVAVVIVAAAALIVIVCLLKKKKSAVACVLLCGMLLGGMVTPVSAGTTNRAMTLTADFPYNGNTYPVTAKISYSYTFTETDVMDTNGMDRFEITYWWGPHFENMASEYFVQKIKECGFTSVPLEHGTDDQKIAALELFREYGLTCSSLMDGRVSALLGSDRNVSPDISQEEVDRVVAEVVADYTEYMDIIQGWHVYDEPHQGTFEILGKIVAAFRKYSPDKETMINLYPTYATNEQLGTNGYKEYLDAFIEQVDPHYISYDHYHFKKGGKAERGYFTNLELIRDKAQESGLDPMLIILLAEFPNFDNLTRSQIMWEVNTSLTYGMKQMSYFLFMVNDYHGETFDNACMNYKGEIYPHYYDVQAINQWLLPLGTELFDKNSTAVFHLARNRYAVEDECEYYDGYGDLGAVEGENFVIGFFDDYSFMITNTKYTEGSKGENTLTLLDIREGLEYFEPMSASWKNAETEQIAVRNENGHLTLTFAAGEGILFRVVSAE